MVVVRGITCAPLCVCKSDKIILCVGTSPSNVLKLITTTNNFRVLSTTDAEDTTDGDLELLWISLPVTLGGILVIILVVVLLKRKFVAENERRVLRRRDFAPAGSPLSVPYREEPIYLQAFPSLDLEY